METLSATTIRSMEQVKHIKDGKKKERAMCLIQYSYTKAFGADEYEKVKDLIPGLIEMVVSLSKHELVIDINKSIKTKCLKLCK